jgi:hypothetical protein
MRQPQGLRVIARGSDWLVIGAAAGHGCGRSRSYQAVSGAHPMRMDVEVAKASPQARASLARPRRCRAVQQLRAASAHGVGAPRTGIDARGDSDVADQLLDRVAGEGTTPWHAEPGCVALAPCSAVGGLMGEREGEHDVPRR